MIDSLQILLEQYLPTGQLEHSSNPTISSCLISIFLALALSLLIGYTFKKFIAPLLLKLVRRTETVWDDYLLNEQLVRALCHTLPGILFYISLPLCLPYEAHPFFSLVITQAGKIYIAITFLKLITVFLSNVERLTKEEERFKERHLYGIIDFLKIVVFFIGAIIIISFTLGQNPLSMIAGIGAAATVLMFVFKDSILGLVAGVQLSCNRMVKPGDWITIKKSDIDGVVENISLTTVKVRNFDNTIHTVPPYTLISEPFQNWSSIHQGGGRRLKRALFLDMNSVTFCRKDILQNLIDKHYFSPEEKGELEGKVNLTLFRMYLSRYLNSRADIIQDKTIMARQLEPTPNGLPLEFYFYLKITAFEKYEWLCAEYMEHFIALLPDFGLRLFQSPTGKDLEGLAEHFRNNGPA